MKKEYTTSQLGAEMLVDICEKKGIKHVVISPGSRNAPLSIAFNRNKNINCYVIIDERSAAFIALGIAQYTQAPVAVVCTSGTALLNFAPAVAEAYYQQIPLIVISADRPPEWIDQNDNQTIRQEHVFTNFTKAFFQIPAAVNTKPIQWFVNRKINELINIACYENKGPVHINIPFREPLYEITAGKNDDERMINLHACEHTLNEDDIHRLSSVINKEKRILIIAGMYPKCDRLNAVLSRLSSLNQVVIINEILSNQQHPDFIPSFERCLIHAVEENTLHPNLIISFGGTLVSNRLKDFLRNSENTEHWYIGKKGGNHIDTFQCLSELIPMSPESFFEQLEPYISSNDSGYNKDWHAVNQTTEKLHDNFVSSIPWSDLAAVHIIMQALPQTSSLQLGNSSSVRYAQLYKHNAKDVYCNRGTSGIDGSCSTAVGAAITNPDFTTLLVGDISFFYDSNAFWNTHVSPNLRIIVLKNSGGGIFRYIKGPSDVEEFETYFETANQIPDLAKFAALYGLEYKKADNADSLKQAMKNLYSLSRQAVVLEVETPRMENDKILKQYYQLFK